MSQLMGGNAFKRALMAAIISPSVKIPLLLKGRNLSTMKNPLGNVTLSTQTTASLDPLLPLAKLRFQLAPHPLQLLRFHHHLLPSHEQLQLEEKMSILRGFPSPFSR